MQQASNTSQIKTASTSTAENIPYDLIVIGSGIAGLSAAVAAADCGASVVVLERSPEADFGGNTRWTESYFRMKSETEVSDDFEERLVSNAGFHLDPNIIEAASAPYADWPPYVKAHGMPDPEIVSTLAEGAGPTVAWLKSFGIRFDFLPTYFVTAAAPRLMPVGGGLAMIEALRTYALKKGVTCLYETTARSLQRRTERAGEQTAVQLTITDRVGIERVLQGKNIVIASGGFQGNPEMLTQYLGQAAKFVRPVAKGGYYNKGEGIRMALNAGAAPAGDFSSYHAEPLDPRSGATEALVMNFTYGILVNKFGERFLNEAPGPVDVNYDHISRAIGEQPDGICYVIFDQRIHDVPNWKKSIRTDMPAFEGSTLTELAIACGLPAKDLERTVQAFNESCPSGAGFKPLEIDGLATQGLKIPKSHWSRPIDQGPFMAYPIIPGICFTYGGIKINSSSQVVDQDGRPIPGLYAAGEATGLYHQVYTGATSVMRGAVFGKIAGEHAMRGE